MTRFGYIVKWLLLGTLPLLTAVGFAGLFSGRRHPISNQVARYAALRA